MDLTRHLRYFVAVADERHFGRAAELLGIAQPPLSQSIQRLERELGVELFDRSGRRVELTAAGRVLLDEARALLAREQRMRRLLQRVRDGSMGTLRAGVPPETPAAVLQALLHQLAVQLPGLEVDLRDLPTAEQVRMLADARLDVGLVHHPVDPAPLRFGRVVTVQFGAVLPRTSPLVRQPEIALADLAGHDLVLFARDAAPGWHDRVIDVCRTHGFSPAHVHHARTLEFQLGLVLAGHGVAFEEAAVAGREPRVAWRPLAGHPLRKTISAAWPGRSPHPAAPRFAAVAARILTSAGPAAVSLATPDTPHPWSLVYAHRHPRTVSAREG